MFVLLIFFLTVLCEGGGGGKGERPVGRGGNGRRCHPGAPPVPLS